MDLGDYVLQRVLSSHGVNARQSNSVERRFGMRLVFISLPMRGKYFRNIKEAVVTFNKTTDALL